MAKPEKTQTGPSPQEGPAPARTKKVRAMLRRHLIAAGLIAGLALLVYSNTFSVPFHFDDRPNITQNPNIQITDFTWDRIKLMIHYTYRESIRVFSYFTFALNYYFGGLNVFGYHLVNLLIHISAGLLLYAFLILTLNLPALRERYGDVSYRVSMFTALLFTVHPVQTQSVTYIVQRMASMAGMFYLLAFVLYILWRLKPGKTRWVCFGGALLSYFLGIFSKENVAILPFFVALYEFYFFQKLDLSPKGKRIVLILAGVLIGLGAIGLIVWGRRYIDVTIEGYQYRTFTMSERVLTQFRVVLHYLTLLLYPHPSRLNLDIDYPLSRTLLDPPTTLLSLLAVAGLIGYGIWASRKRPLLSFCILWYFGNLAIESSIFPLEMVFEHRLYLPSVGPLLLFSLLVIQGTRVLMERGQAKKALGWDEK